MLPDHGVAGCLPSLLDAHSWHGFSGANAASPLLLVASFGQALYAPVSQAILGSYIHIGGASN